MYRKEAAPESYDSDWIDRELKKVEEALNIFDFLYLKSQGVELDKPRNGMVVYANGTTWDPGSGEGIYAYYAGSYHKLG